MTNKIIECRCGKIINVKSKDIYVSFMHNGNSAQTNMKGDMTMIKYIICPECCRVIDIK